MPDDNVLHESIQTGSVPIGLLCPRRSVSADTISHSTVSNGIAGFGRCGFERFVTSPAEIETILFKNADRCRRFHSDFPHAFWNLDRSLSSLASNQDSTRQPKSS